MPPRVGLFVPCYVDHLRPDVAWASLALLEEQGLEVVFPEHQTCCGQPLWSAGDHRGARRLAARFADAFSGCEYVVAPSGSCVAMVRRHFAALLGDDARAADLAGRTRELCEFLVDVCGVAGTGRRFPHRTVLHVGCHALRELRSGPTSERPGTSASPGPAERLVSALGGIELVPWARADECCGFGGVFAVDEEAVSVFMGEDRLHAAAEARAEVLLSTDVSCLLHLEGLARRRGPGLRARHVAEALAGAGAP